MIIAGCIARNSFEYMNNYNDHWAVYIRMCCLMTILLRGGLELEFRGKGLIVVLLTFVP